MLFYETKVTHPAEMLTGIIVYYYTLPERNTYQRMQARIQHNVFTFQEEGVPSFPPV